VVVFGSKSLDVGDCQFEVIAEIAVLGSNSAYLVLSACLMFRGGLCHPQVTAWSKRRSQAGASAVIIGVSPRQGGAAVR